MVSWAGDVGALPELAEGERVQGSVDTRDMGVVLGIELEGQIGGGEGGDGVLVGIGGGDLVLTAVEQVKTQALRAGGAGIEDEGLVGGRDVGVGGLGEVGEEDMTPGGDAGGGGHPVRRGRSL